LMEEPRTRSKRKSYLEVIASFITLTKDMN